MTYFYRFVQTNELGSFPPCLFASTCVLLASKTTERVSTPLLLLPSSPRPHLTRVAQPVPLRDLVNSYYSLVYPMCEPLEISNEYWRLRETVVTQEQQLLRALRFQLDVQFPYTFLLNYGRTFGYNNETVRCAYALLNDCMATDACVRHAAHVLAAAALTAAAAILNAEPAGGGGGETNLNISGGGREQRRWHLVCDVTDDALAQAVAAVLIAHVPPPALPPPPQGEIDAASATAASGSR